MSHLCVDSKETKSWVAGKTTIIVLHQVFEIVPDGNWDLTLAKEVTCSGGEKGGEGTGEESLCCELIQWHSSNGGVREEEVDLP